jgi:hypothetical protein
MYSVMEEENSTKISETLTVEKLLSNFESLQKDHDKLKEDHDRLQITFNNLLNALNENLHRIDESLSLLDIKTDCWLPMEANKKDGNYFYGI